MASQAFTIPLEWPEYCKKSNPWCEGFHEALVKAVPKYDNINLKTIISEIEGKMNDNVNNPMTTTIKQDVATKQN